MEVLTIAIGLLVIAMFALPAFLEGLRGRERHAEAPPLVRCSDCRAEISSRAETCPKCGAPQGAKADRGGLVCPSCKNRDSERVGISPGCAFWIIAIFTFGLAFLAYFLMPRRWRCNVCGNVWRV